MCKAAGLSAAQGCLCRLSAEVVSIQIIIWANAPGISRLVSQHGFATLPAVVKQNGVSAWSGMFQSRKVPKALVVESSTGRTICADAIVHVKAQDAAATFPWHAAQWAEQLDACIASAAATSCDTSARKECILVRDGCFALNILT